MISAMSVDVILCCKIERGGVNGETFIEFVENNLMSVLMPLDGCIQEML